MKPSLIILVFVLGLIIYRLVMIIKEGQQEHEPDSLYDLHFDEDDDDEDDDSDGNEPIANTPKPAPVLAEY